MKNKLINSRWLTVRLSVSVMHYQLFTIVWLLFSIVPAKGQDQGEIQKVEFEIVKDREIKLPQASRNFDKVPPRAAEPTKPEIGYSFNNLSFSTPDYNPAIRPLKVKQNDRISKIYGNYLSAGYGNFASPYLEGYATNKRDKNKFYGLKLFHRSFGSGPVGEGNSASSKTEIKAFGKVITSSLAARGFLMYENRGAKFYGTVPNGFLGDAALQTYAVFSLGADIANANKSDFNYALKGGFSYLKDNFKASENETNLNFTSIYHFDDKKLIQVEADYFLMNRKTETLASSARHVLKIRPSYRFSPTENFVLSVGVNAAFANDSLGNEKSFRFYPNVNASYQLAEGLQVFGALIGDIDRVSLHSLSRENTWLNQNVELNNTNRTIDIAGGVRGKLAGKFAYQVGLSIANVKNLYFYQNNLAVPSKFDVVYDKGNVQRTNLFLELNYNQTRSVRLALRGDYFGYSTDMVAAAFHRPTYLVSFNSILNIYDKVVLDVDMLLQGGMKGLSNESAFSSLGRKTVDIPSAFDLNAKATYLVSNQFSVFASFNNILNNNYQAYLYYPVRGFQAMAGASFSF
ncbi:MAG: hypothetical protein ACKOEV_02675 [Cytophagales bacterium]